MASLFGSGLQSIITTLAGLGTIVQILVLAALLVASLTCWGIIGYKFWGFRAVQHENMQFLQAFRSADDLPFMAAAARRFGQAPLARLFRTAQQQMEALNSQRLGANERDMARVSATVLEQLRHVLSLRQAEEIERLEHGLPFLATTASVAPFVGLLGTVWGIMQSFHAIGQGGGASLAVVGPGISEALVATAAGLAAAIPAVIAYNHYLNRLRRLEGAMNSFIEELIYVFGTAAPGEAPRARLRTPLQS